MPFLAQANGTRFLRNIIQSERPAWLSRGEPILKDQLNAEERDILERFEREIEEARLAARNTHLKTERVKLRVTERDPRPARSQAREEGIPYQTVLSRITHK